MLSSQANCSLLSTRTINYANSCGFAFLCVFRFCCVFGLGCLFIFFFFCFALLFCLFCYGAHPSSSSSELWRSPRSVAVWSPFSVALMSEGNCRLKELFNTRKCWAWTVSSTDGPFHWLSALLSQSLELPVSQTRYASHRSGQRIFIRLPGIWEEEE